MVTYITIKRKESIENHLEIPTMQNLLLPFDLTGTTGQLKILRNIIETEKNQFKKYNLLKQERTVLNRSIDRYFYLFAK